MLKFKAINLCLHFDLAVQFRRDSFNVSNVSNELSNASAEAVKKYRQYLDQRVDNFPEGNVHVWENQYIIGQIESTPLSYNQGKIGHINLFYLAPSYRGLGLGKQLDYYIKDIFRSIGIKDLQLIVSSSNKKAIQFYCKYGWFFSCPPVKDFSSMNPTTMLMKTNI